MTAFLQIGGRGYLHTLRTTRSHRVSNRTYIADSVIDDAYQGHISPQQKFFDTEVHVLK